MTDNLTLSASKIYVQIIVASERQAAKIATSITKTSERELDLEFEANRIFDMIINDGGKMRKRDITRRTQRLNYQQREEVFAWMVRQGMIVIEQDDEWGKFGTPPTYVEALTQSNTA